MNSIHSQRERRPVSILQENPFPYDRMFESAHQQDQCVINIPKVNSIGEHNTSRSVSAEVGCATGKTFTRPAQNPILKIPVVLPMPIPPPPQDDPLDIKTNFEENPKSNWFDNLSNSSSSNNNNANGHEALVVVNPKQERRSYTREFKLMVVDWYLMHGENKSKTARHFNVSCKQIRDWVRNRRKVEDQERGSRASGRGCTARYPLMEKTLYEEFLEMHRRGVPVTRDWFLIRARQLIEGLYADVTFKSSPQWFKKFCARFKIINPDFVNTDSINLSPTQALNNPPNSSFQSNDHTGYLSCNLKNSNLLNQEYSLLGYETKYSRSQHINEAVRWDSTSFFKDECHRDDDTVVYIVDSDRCIIDSDSATCFDTESKMSY